MGEEQGARWWADVSAELDAVIAAPDSAEPIIFLDHFNEEAGRWEEILVSDPKNSPVIVDVIQLPNEKEAARRFATSYDAQK